METRSKILDMTMAEMEHEIVFLRKWEKFIARQIGATEYEKLANEFSREYTITEFRKLGLSEDEAKDICNKVDKSMKKEKGAAEC